MNNTYYLARLCPQDEAFKVDPHYNILGVFSTLKNAEDVVIACIKNIYDENFIGDMSDEYYGEENDEAYLEWLYSDQNILNSMEAYYMIDKIEIDKVY